MNFSTVQRVLETLRAGDEVEWTRGENRIKVQNAANNVPPLDQETARKLNIKVNINWGELMVQLSNACRQYLTAFWSNNSFFKVMIPLAPSDHQSEWGAFITDFIARKMRNSLEYFELHRSRWSAVVCHGLGPIRWPYRDRWLPKYLAIEDFRVATDVTLDFTDLGWFGCRHYYTPFELLNNAFYEMEPRRWQKKMVANILRTYKEVNYDYAPNHYDWETTPEKFAELAKQDGGYYSADAMPKIPLWHFYFQDHDEDGNEGWWMRVVPDQGYVKGAQTENEFLWTSPGPLQPTWKRIVHCQYGDLNFKSPRMFHSVRSLGLMLLDPTFHNNLTMCRALQHLHDNFNVWLRVTDPVDKARPQIQEFANFGVVKPGLSIIGQGERHQIDNELFESISAKLKQFQQEASATYTQQTDTGTKREQTAFETSVKLQQVNALMSGLLVTAFIYAKHEYTEICRRFCLTKTSDPDIQEFRRGCIQAGIPDRWMNHNLWDIEPVTPIGMGNPMLAESKSQQLMSIRPAFDEEAQQEILHETALVMTGDPRKAARWVPLGRKRGMTDSQRDAQQIFGTLMQGVILPPRQGLSPVEQIQTLLPLMAGVITRIEQRHNVGTPDEIAGLKTVAQYIFGLMSPLAGDPNRKQQVKEFSDALGNLMNQVKGLEQRGAEQQQRAGAQMDPKDLMKVRGMMMLNRAKLLSKKQSDAQRMRRDEQRFIREERRKDASTYHDIQRDQAQLASAMD